MLYPLSYGGAAAHFTAMRRAARARHQSNWQAPGQPGWPHEPQPAGASLNDAAAPLVTAAKVESFLVSSVPWQAGHSITGSDDRTSFSNSLPQVLHAYSNIGMTRAPQNLAARSDLSAYFNVK